MKTSDLGLRTSARAIAIALLVLVACGPNGKRPDASTGGDTSGSGDASMFGAPCATSTDCTGGGYCVDNLGGKVCTYECSAGCPTNWTCRATKVDGSLVSICIPPDFQLCTMCSANAQCNGGACIPLGGMSFCLPPCPVEGTCPQGYTCGPDPTGMNPGQFCVPMTKSCTCTSGGDDGQVRTCTTTNMYGTCQGTEVCHPTSGGWQNCTAPMASPEVCNGLDDDCNGLIDDGLGGQPCTNTNGFGTCNGVTLCTGSGGIICQGPTAKAETCNYADDDCDGMTDEGFAGLGNVCNAGTGACQRFGVIRCTADGSATECSATAGPPVPELCNGIDDDCDGTIDETFPTLGNACAAGVGQCARQGAIICTANGSGTTCNAVPGTPTAELCNNLDDDCDGKTDEDFKNAGGVYDTDQHCGSCSIDCTQQFNVPNAAGHCVVTTTASCTMTCNPGAFDLDGAVSDGCEFILDPDAIYVSTDDAAAIDDTTCGLGPVGTGAGHYPCKTITHGIARAIAATKSKVLVANGTYSEYVALSNGKSLLGGYRPDNWVRDVASTDTVIDGFTTTGVHVHTVDAINIISATTFEGFVVYGVADPLPSGNSYAIYVSGSNNNLAIKNNVIFGGVGGPGAPGGNGTDGPNGANGSGRSTNLTVTDVAYDSKDANATSGECDLSNNRQYTNGGATTCGAVSTAGGNGGGNRCPVKSTCTPSSTSGYGCTIVGNQLSFVWNEYSAIDGFVGAAGGGANGGTSGAFGIAGDDGIQVYATVYGGYVCYLPTDTDGDGNNTYGLDGGDGGKGGNGNGVAGCSMSGGGVVGSNWVGGLAATGLAGGNGGGGGGGGAGGGGKCIALSGKPCTDGGGHDTLGAHGGGGGAGACGGGAGGGATSGGGAFGIFIIGTTAPVVSGNQFFKGQGGSGGAGGAGGKGGVGGAGGLGGTTGAPGVFCTDTAGKGGNGGNGGHGSGGGGGCGGSSFGIYTSGLGTALNYCTTANNTFSGGSGGAGGPGGYSIINQGGNGSAGVLMDCTFN